MDFRILGPVEVLSEGQPLPLGGQRQRALLAYLLLHANEVVAGERLLDELWAEPPGGGVAALQSQISRLRRVVGDRIETAGAGYLIRVQPGELDLERFRALLAEAAAAPAPSERSRYLREADALWRGVPLAGLDVPFAAAEASALEELRLAAVEDRLEADLELGHRSELVGELHGLVARHPLRERLRGALILALYRSGRQADALEAYREARRLLDEELGLEPGPALRELERAILRHDPALERATPAVVEAEAAAPRRGARRRATLVLALLVLAGVGVGASFSLGSFGGASTTKAAPTQPVPTLVRTVVVHAHPVARHRTRRKPVKPKRQQIVKRTVTAPKPATTRTAPAASPATGSPATTTSTTTTKRATPPVRKPTTPTARAATISDTFDGGRVDGTIWYPIEQGTGWNMNEQGGHLEFTFLPGAAPGGPYDVYGGHVGTLCKFPGNFDARVDFTLVGWPPANGVQAALWSFFGPTNIGWQAWRWSSPQWGEEYGSYTGPAGGGGASVTLDDTSGTLRLVRRAGLVTAYFLHKGIWQSLTSGRSTLSATIAVGAGSITPSTPLGDRQVVVDFDNFTVTGDHPMCPPGAKPGG